MTTRYSSVIQMKTGKAGGNGTVMKVHMRIGRSGGIGISLTMDHLMAEMKTMPSSILTRFMTGVPETGHGMTQVSERIQTSSYVNGSMN